MRDAYGAFLDLELPLPARLFSGSAALEHDDFVAVGLFDSFRVGVRRPGSFNFLWSLGLFLVLTRLVAVGVELVGVVRLVVSVLLPANFPLIVADVDYGDFGFRQN